MTPAEPPQFVVYADPALFQQVTNHLLADPEVRVLKVGGPATAPDRVVAQMPTSTADALRKTFQDQVTVEPDQPLTAYS